MPIAQEQLDVLFDECCESARVSASQSLDGILQSARRRLASGQHDRKTIHLIAASQLQARNAEQCLAVLNGSANIFRDDPIAHRLAGHACLLQDNPQEARSHFEQSIHLDACQADCWMTLGQIHQAAGLTDLAIEHYQRAIILGDGEHAAALALSSLYAGERDLTEAIHTLRVSLIRDQRSPKLNLALARLLQSHAAVLARKKMHRARGRILQEAAGCYRTVNSSAPTAKTYISQGILEQKLERFDEAKRCFERAVALDPQNPSAITHLANANVESGDINQALGEFRSAIECDPQRAAAHFRYSRAKRFQSDPETDRYIKQLAELAADNNRPTVSLVHLNFALAKVLDDIGRYDEAWLHYDRANRLKPGHTQSLSQPGRRHASRHRSKSRIPLKQATDRAIDFFTREFFGANQAIGNPSETPLFIVGMPRSGTTLTEQILSSHNAIAGAGELKGIDRIRQDLVADARRLRATQRPTKRERIYPDVLMTLSSLRIRELADEYLTHLNGHRSDELRVSDKMPTNFMHLGLITLLFPRATIVHCRRNPLDVLVSCYCQNLNPPFCDLDQLVQYHRQYCRMMDHWNRVLPQPIYTVDYEALVTNPEPTAQGLIRHCRLPWDDRCLEFHTNKRAVHTPSKWQVRQPLYATSIAKWKRFEPHLRHIARQFDGHAFAPERSD